MYLRIFVADAETKARLIKGIIPVWTTNSTKTPVGMCTTYISLPP